MHEFRPESQSLNVLHIEPSLYSFMFRYSVMGIRDRMKLRLFQGGASLVIPFSYSLIHDALLMRYLFNLKLPGILSPVSDNYITGISVNSEIILVIMTKISLPIYH